MNGTNKYFVIYKVTNKINSRFYIGMHTTNNPNDGYLGSGRRIKAEVKKYGKENFVKEILEYLPCKISLAAREKEIVNEELLADPFCLNLKNGGEGGGKFWSKEHHSIASRNGAMTTNKQFKSGSSAAAERSKKSAATFKRKIASGEIVIQSSFGFLGKQHSPESRAKISASNAGNQIGKLNSQFGTCWVNDGRKAVKIKKEQLSEYLIKGYSSGRKLF